jgi:hypothetical protein
MFIKLIQHFGLEVEVIWVDSRLLNIYQTVMETGPGQLLLWLVKPVQDGPFMGSELLWAIRILKQKFGMHVNESTHPPL